MRFTFLIFIASSLLSLTFAGSLTAEELLFEETFDEGLSEVWKIKGLEESDYRVRDGGLEVRLRPGTAQGEAPLFRVDLPFSTAGLVTASVEVTVVAGRLQRGEVAGMCLLDKTGSLFRVRKTNVDGYFVLAPGKPEFIGPSGTEGSSDYYTVKYWPALDSAGPLRILVRGHYAYFQTGPDAEGKYRNYFHSAIRQTNTGLGFGLFVRGNARENDCWVRFDNFRVTRD